MSSRTPIGESSTLSHTTSGKAILHLRGFEPEMDGKRISVDSWQIVDSGATASILVGELEQNHSSTRLKVALKVFPAILTKVTRELLQRELDISRTLNHPLILPFLGTCELDTRTVLVSRFMKNGNLSTYLEKNPTADRDRLVVQVSDAVLYLHETVRVAHGDLKCENVLVSDVGDAFLADFGLSTTREKAETEATTTIAIRTQGTLRFCAPELLFGDDSQAQTQGRPRSKTHQSDVYAFGMLLLQAYTGKMPWDGMKDRAVIVQIGANRSPPRPDVEELNDLLWTVCEACWRSDPDSRPRMKPIATLLKQNMESSQRSGAFPPSIDVLHFLYNAKEDTKHELPRRPLPEPRSITPVLFCILEHPAYMYAIIYMPDGDRIVSGCYDGKITIWDLNSGGMIGAPMAGHTQRVFSVAISADATRIASGSEDKTIRIWSIESRMTIARLEGHTKSVYAVAFSPDGLRVVSGSYDKTIRVWDVASAKTVVGPIQGHRDRVYSVAYSPDGLRIVSSSSDGTVCVWNVDTGENLWREVTSSPVLSVAYSPDGERIVAGDSDEKVHVLHANTGKIVLGPLKGHTDWVNSVTFSPDGKIIASGSDDYTLRLYSATTGAELNVISGHGGAVKSVAFSPNGRRVASASADATVRVWDITNA